MMLKANDNLDDLIESRLKPLRVDQKAILPAAEWVNWQPISLQRDRAIWQDYLQQVPWLSQLENQKLPNYKVVIDLDETLLLNSYSCPEIWEIGGGYQDDEIYPAYQYSQMRKTWRGRFKRILGRTDYDTADQNAYPFLQNPRHIVMFRPGMLGGLAWLAEKGVELILVTASARQRVTYLLKRFPLLAEVFGDRVICANEIMHSYLTQISSATQINDEASRQAFEKRPFSLAIKTPDLINRILGNGGYDLIVDDSAILAETFQETPLRDRLLWVRSDLAVSDYGMQIVAAITASIMKEPELFLKASALKKLDLAFESRQIVPSSSQMIRLEDPYCWPLCHGRDQLSPSTNLQLSTIEDPKKL
jgi:hypothetical protein